MEPFPLVRFHAQLYLLRFFFYLKQRARVYPFLKMLACSWDSALFQSEHHPTMTAVLHSDWGTVQIPNANPLRSKRSHDVPGLSLNTWDSR